MNSLGDPDPNFKTFLRHNSQQNDLFFPKHYLLLEVERLEVSLKHFYETETISKDDYEYLSLTLKMMRRFLAACVRTPKKRDFDFRKRTWNHNKISSQKQTISKNRFPKQVSLFDSQNPLPIKGEIVVSGLNENLKALRPKEPKKSGPKFPYKIPAGTHWNNVIIKFLDEEFLEIRVKNLKHITNYIEMGMVGKGKIPEPSEQWVFLKVLAKYNGELTIKDNEAKDKYKKQKQALTETLRNYFSIDYDPFYPYHSTPEKGGNSYKIKLILIPPPDTNNNQENHIVDNEDNLGIAEFLNEQAPQVLDS